ncbi:ankyrin repeat protein [Diplodia corticola]|uniref:Ankyrin repeat protein n=1 Tax=Diplodia corticola TaxID=236234 RepID=A0A1J9R891_9PEZI|nr:ankyrin repeat protein [Diplodia corticola]OJD36800.1 ankyrin repeat protein [Diplodia corticola]
MDPLSICASAANVAQLAGIIISKLAAFCDAASHVDITVSGFGVEIHNFQIALQLVAETKKIWQLRQMTDLEENHWTRIDKLLGRCRQTLVKLQSILENAAVKQTTLGRRPMTQLKLDMKSHIISILRSHIKSYTQALQVSLSTLTLANQLQSHASIEHELQELSRKIQDVKSTLLSRPAETEKVDDPETADIEADMPGEHEINEDVEQVIMSAAAVSEAATSVDSDSIRSGLQLTDPPIHRWMDGVESPPPQSPGAGPSFKNEVTPPRMSSASESDAPVRGEPKDSGIGSDEHSDDEDDPDPNLDDHFSEGVLKRLIERFHNQAIEEFDKGNYHRAETAQNMMMRYLEEGRRNHGMEYDNAEVFERLAQIYYKQKQLEEARKIYTRLLEEHKRRTPDIWRWYFSYAKIYQEQERLEKAARYAKRAFTGAEKSLPKGDPFIFDAVALLAHIYQQQGEHILAEALREQYLGDKPRQPSLTERKLSLEVMPSGSSGRSWLTEVGHDPASPAFDPKSAIKLSIEKDSEAGVTEVLHRIQDVEKQRALAKESLKWAIQGGRREIANLLMELDLGIGKDSLFADGKTPLIHAIQAKEDGIVQDILQKGASPETRCARSITPLIHAVTAGHEPIAAHLLGKGARVDATSYECTALHRAVDLKFAVLVKLLLAYDAGLECMGPRKWMSLGSSGKRLPASKDCKADTHPTHVDASWTPLLLSSFAGSSEISHLLLEKHAHIEAKTSTGGTPLMYAAEERHLTTVRLLLSAGADVHATDKKGDTALHRAVRKSGSVEIIDSILGKGGSLDTPNKERETTLHIAASKNGGERLLGVLLDRQANREARDVAGRTPLHVAIEKRQEGNVATLIERGADISATDNYGQSSVKLAQRSSPEIQMLIKKHKKRSNPLSSSMSRRGSDRSSTTEGSVRGRQPSVSSKFTFLDKLR